MSADHDFFEDRLVPHIGAFLLIMMSLILLSMTVFLGWGIVIGLWHIGLLRSLGVGLVVYLFFLLVHVVATHDKFKDLF